MVLPSLDTVIPSGTLSGLHKGGPMRTIALFTFILQSEFLFSSSPPPAPSSSSNRSFSMGVSRSLEAIGSQMLSREERVREENS